MNDAWEDIPDSIQLVLQKLQEQGEVVYLRSFDAPARRASEAADLLGCPLGAVVKSLVFQIGESKAVLVLVSGENRADLAVLSRILGQSVIQASPTFVRQRTGFPVGAVPPFGIDAELQVIIDETLMDYANIWASAGSAHTLMRLSPAVLVEQTQGIVRSVF